MKNVLRKIVKDIWAYILWIILVVVVWTVLFGYLTRIKTEEKVCVFIGSQSINFDKSEELNEKRPEYLKEVEVNAYSVNDGMFATFLNIFGYEMSDIFILPESSLSEDDCPQHYAEISETYREQFVNLGFYSVDNKVYGIRIHERGNAESLINCIDFGEGDKEEDYYMLFNVKSIHLSDLSDESKQNQMDGAIKIAQEMLGL